MVEWCTHEFALPDTRAHRFVVTRSKSTAHAQWESPKQSFHSPFSSTGVNPERSSISLTTVATDRSRWHATHGDQILEDSGRTQGQCLKLTTVKGTANATDVATKHVHAATLQKCMTTIGLINRTGFLAAVIMA